MHPADNLHARMVSMLVSLEWSGQTCDSSDGTKWNFACPWCDGTKPGEDDPEFEGHADDCHLAELLRQVDPCPHCWGTGSSASHDPHSPTKTCPDCAGSGRQHNNDGA